jgi:membrane protein required for colicin V production
MSMLPDDPESTILKRLKKPKPDEDQPDNQHSGLAPKFMQAELNGTR